MSGNRRPPAEVLFDEVELWFTYDHNKNQIKLYWDPRALTEPALNWVNGVEVEGTSLFRHRDRDGGGLMLEILHACEVVPQFISFIDFDPDAERTATGELASPEGNPVLVQVILGQAESFFDTPEHIYGFWKRDKIPLEVSFNPAAEELIISFEHGEPTRVFDVDSGAIQFDFNATGHLLAIRVMDARHRLPYLVGRVERGNREDF